MNVAFFYPLALLGALAVAVPLWLHLHRRFRGNVVRFSAMRFLHDEPLARRAPLRLKNPLLLALRVLAVLLLAAAFAWPYNQRHLAPPSLESRVYLLDNTLSHQADGAFESNRDRLADEIQNTPAQTQVAVVELAAQPRVLVPFDQDPTSAAEVVRRLRPTFERGSYAAAFRLADTLLRSSSGDRRRLLVYSDHQANQYEELLESPPFLEGIEVEAIPGELEERPNLALSRPQLRRMLAGSQSLLELTLELFHQGDITSAAVRVTSSGRQVFERTVDLQDAPQRFILTMRWEEARGAAVQGEAVVDGRPDALSADNRVYFALPPVRRGRVDLVARSTFLTAALAPDVMQQAWQARTAEPADALAAARRGQFADVLCLESHYLSESNVARTLLRRYLAADRGVLLVLDDAQPEAIQTLRELGFAVDPQPVVAAAPQPIGYVQLEHPIFQPFRSPDFGSLRDVRFSRHFAVQSTDATPLLFSDSGEPLLFEAGGNRKLLVTAFPLDRQATDWPLHTTFVPLLDRCLERLRGEEPPPADLLPGEVSLVHLPAEFSSRTFTLSGAEGVLQSGPIEGRPMPVTAPARPGLYVLEWDSDADEPLWLAVNPPPAESELTYSDPADVVSRILQPQRPSQTVAPAPATSRDLTQADILQQRLWWVILIVGLAALFAENAWVGLRGRAT